MSRYNRCKECYNMKCVFVTGEREDFDTSECPDFREMTNAERIRQMTDEELAETYAGGCPNGDRLNCGKYYLHGGRDCFNCWLDWLKSPVEKGE